MFLLLKIFPFLTFNCPPIINMNTTNTILLMKLSISIYCSLGTLQSGQFQQSQGISCTNNPNLGGSSPLAMPVFPLRSQTGHGSQYSPYSPSRFVIWFEIVFSSFKLLFLVSLICLFFLLLFVFITSYNFLFLLDFLL